MNADNANDEEERQHQLELWRVLKANRDLAKRALGLLQAFYDEELDLLMVCVGENRNAVAIHLDETFVIRYDMDTHKIISFELFHFHELLAERSPYVRLLFGLMQACGPVEMKLYPEPNFETEFQGLASVKQD